MALFLQYKMKHLSEWKTIMVFPNESEEEINIFFEEFKKKQLYLDFQILKED